MNTNEFVESYKKGLINEKEIYAIFKDKHFGEFCAFLNSFSFEFFIKKKNVLSIECRQLLYGKNKAQEAFEYFNSIGESDTAKRVFDLLTKRNK